MRITIEDTQARRRPVTGSKQLQKCPLSKATPCNRSVRAYYRDRDSDGGAGARIKWNTEHPS